MVTEIGIPILTKEIAQRVAYAESLTMGSGKPGRLRDRKAYEGDS